MRSITLHCIFVVILSTPLLAQTTTVFGGYKWYDLVKDPNYSKENKSKSEVVVSADSIKVVMNNQTFRYSVKSVKEIPKEFTTEYTVEMNGKPELISIRKASAGVANITDSNKSWLVVSKVEGITPLGYQFPGEPRIDLEAERTKLPGFYKFVTMSFSRKIDINRDGIATTSYADELSACQQDVQIEFFADNTGTWSEGQTKEACKKSETKFKWELKDMFVKAEHVLTLVLKMDEFDINTYRVKELTKGGLEIIGEFNFGTEDSTVEAGLYLWKVKKKK